MGPAAGPVAVRYLVNAGQLAAGSWYLDEKLEGSRFVGEGGHFVDTVSALVGRSPVEVYAAGSAPTSTLTLRYDDGSVASVSYLTRGSSRFPKETLDVTAGGRSGRLDNFRKVRSGRRRTTGRARRTGQDKGQRAAAPPLRRGRAQWRPDADPAGVAGRDDPGHLRRRHQPGDPAPGAAVSGAPDLGWYVRRLRRMSAAEVTRRARRPEPAPAVGPSPGPAGAPRHRHPRGSTSGRSAPACPEVREQLHAEAAAAVVAAADRVLAGRWTVLRRRPPGQRRPGLVPRPGHRAPRSRRALAFAVDHRDEAETGNVKQVWEMSRHHHLTVLAAAWWVTREDRYADAVADQLRSWWRANPYLTGVHWTNGIEVGVRLLAWVWIRRLLDDWPKVDDLFENDTDALRQIAWHQEYLAAFPSHGSSANNHVLAEAAGLLAGACAFDWYARSPRWRAEAAAAVERELAANTFPSGLNRELATDYHRFVLELALVAAVEADAAGSRCSRRRWQLLARMLDAAAAVLDVAGGAPRAGRRRRGPRRSCVDDPERDPWAVVLGAGEQRRRPAAWWPATRPSVAAALLAGSAATSPLAERAPEPVRDRFDDAGLVLLRTRARDVPEIWCRCDGGPHGFLSIAAHAHADALSVEVRHDGVEILADPGTYCYHGDPAQRQWFRSTRRAQHARARRSRPVGVGRPLPLGQPGRHDDTGLPGGRRRRPQRWVAEHDGYRRLAQPAVHRRAVTLDQDERLLTVVDTVDVAAEVPVRLSWHLGPDVSADLDGDTARLAWRLGAHVRRATLVLPHDLRWSAHRGEPDGPLGWYAPGLGRAVPATSLVGAGTVSASARLVTVLLFG